MLTYQEEKSQEVKILKEYKCLKENNSGSQIDSEYDAICQSDMKMKELTFL